jgi:hypothetical protein
MQSSGRKDLLFALTHEYELYQIFQGKISGCDKQIQKLLNEQINTDDNKKQHHIGGKVHKRLNKNNPDININSLSYQYFEGVDLPAIEGVSPSQLRLAPNNKISGGRILSNKIPKGSNRLKIALRQAAYSN